ncbi:MAG TPA: hemerythrin domain-containing protein [Acidobacteriota bacterium]|nr:hemerythrin domain-containing protein [Acidobacteriota bacterium]
MKRHKSLHELSRHHHFALVEALSIRRARQEPVERRPAAMKKVAETFVRFWQEKGRLHFREEEEILLPAYASHVSLENDPDVIRMLAEHASLRARIGRVALLLNAKESLESDLVELGHLLHDHIRLEENIIFPRIEETLSEEELQQIGRSLTRLHPKDSCGL